MTENVIRQWVRWRVIAPAKARGRFVGTSPEWQRDERALRRATRLAQLRKLGVIRRDAVIVQAFLEWGYPGLETVRQSMVRELRKCLAIIMRRRTSRLDGLAYKDTGAARRKAIKNQLGRLERFLIVLNRGGIPKRSPM